MRAGCLFAVACVVACGPAIPPLPSQGGPAWLEVKSEHFVLWTDASAERGRELVRELEQRRQVITSAMNASSRATAFVIAPRDRRELYAFVDPGIAGVAWSPANPLGQAGIIFAASAGDERVTVNHELGHVISFGIIKNQPTWLAEGIATYFEKVDPFPGDATVEIGLPRDDRLRYLRGSRPLTMSELFACESLDCETSEFYATSWAAVSFLLNERHRELGRYLQNLNQLPSTGLAHAWYDSLTKLSPDERSRQLAAWRELLAGAWRDAFPDLPLDRLDRELSEWLVTGKLRLPRIRLSDDDVRVSERPLNDADVLAARSFLRVLFTDDRIAARADVTAALAADRTNVLAHLMAAALTGSISAADAQATAVAHPEDWRAWRLVELALHGTPEGEAARDRLCTLSANEAPECRLRR